MEFINFEELIKSKIAECEEWLVGEEKARKNLDDANEALKNAYEAVENARVALAEYNEENIARVCEYRKELREHIGLVDVVADEPVVVEEEIPVAVEETPIA